MTNLPDPAILASDLFILAAYSAAVFLFSHWLARKDIIFEDLGEEGIEEDGSEAEEVAASERWVESAEGVMVPRVDRIHVIPLEDPVDSNDPDLKHAYLHCATMECWCNPQFTENDDMPCFNGKIVRHNAMTEATAGWVTIGENLSGID